MARPAVLRKIGNEYFRNFQYIKNGLGKDKIIKINKIGHKLDTIFEIGYN